MDKKRAIFYLVIAVCLIGNSLEAAVIVDHMMTRDPNSGTGCETPTPNYVFGTGDARAYCWVEMADVIEGDSIRYEWYDPAAALYAEYTHTISFTGNGCAWDWITIRNDLAADMPGQWRMDVFYNGSFQFTENFTIREGNPCPVRQLYGDTAAETQLLRFVRDNILYQTPEGREVVALYYRWSPAIVKAMEGDDAFREELKDLIDGLLILLAEEH